MRKVEELSGSYKVIGVKCNIVLVHKGKNSDGSDFQWLELTFTDAQHKYDLSGGAKLIGCFEEGKFYNLGLNFMFDREKGRAKFSIVDYEVVK